MKKKILIISSSVLGFFMLFFSIMLIYFSIYYKADIESDVLLTNNDVIIYENKDYIMFEPTISYNNAFIFYQGAKVDEVAYAPMIKEIAKNGILCFIIKSPFNFALFDINAAEDIISMYLDQNLNWYVGGHSLGGSMSSIFANSNKELVTGVILFGSYSTKDISDLKVLSIYGTDDRILNIDKYNECKSNLPSEYKEVVINGGNHANFAYYGEQNGDGKALISKEEQIYISVNECINFIQSNL